MERRDFIALLGSTALLWPLIAHARTLDGKVRIGFLGSRERLTTFRQGLAELAYVEGRDIVIEFRSSDPADRLPGFAAELVALNVDIIVAGGSQAVHAAQQATRSIPIVMTGSSDPVETGFVASLARPGGNITGLSLQSPELSGKRLQWLRAIVKNLTHLAILLNPEDPPVVFSLKETEGAARNLAMAVSRVEVRRQDELDRAFARIAEMRPQALVILPASLMTKHATRIAELAMSYRMPAISYFKGFPVAGGLMSYGPSLDDLSRRAAVYVDRILKGTKPSELPVQLPTKFELVINLKTARTFGLEVSPMLLALADELIE